jgi:hypothetical protein
METSMEKEVKEVKVVREVEDATAVWWGSRRRNIKRGLATEAQSHREDRKMKRSKEQKERGKRLDAEDVEDARAGHGEIGKKERVCCPGARVFLCDSVSNLTAFTRLRVVPYNRMRIAEVMLCRLGHRFMNELWRCARA